MLVKGPGKTVFLVEDGRKRPITTAVMRFLGFDISAVHALSEDELAVLAHGDILKVSVPPVA